MWFWYPGRFVWLLQAILRTLGARITVWIIHTLLTSNIHPFCPENAKVRADAVHRPVTRIRVFF